MNREFKYQHTLSNKLTRSIARHVYYDSIQAKNIKRTVEQEAYCQYLWLLTAKDENIECTPKDDKQKKDLFAKGVNWYKISLLKDFEEGLYWKTFGCLMGKIKDGNFCYNYPCWWEVFVLFYEKYFHLFYPQLCEKVQTEAEYKRQLGETLQQHGWNVSYEVPVKHGIIDLLARRRDETRIIEAKLNHNSNDVAHALGQLLFYQISYPHASLWFASPKRTHAEYILQFHHVKIIHDTELSQEWK